MLGTRTAFIAAALFALLPWPARAQPSIADFTAPPQYESAALSPSGRQVAAIANTPEGDRLAVFDVATGAIRFLTIGDAGESREVDWVAWKSDDRLILSMRRVVQVPERQGNWRRPRDMPAEITVNRVFSLTPDGERLTEMFRNQFNRSVYDADTFLIDTLPNIRDMVLLAAFGAQGLTLWRVNTITGDAFEINIGDWNTRDWWADRDGNPVLRRDALADDVGFRISRRPPYAGVWHPVIEVHDESISNSIDFRPLGAGPAPGQVYVLARPGGRDLAALYIYDAATGAYSAPLYEHPEAEVADAVVRRYNRAPIGACTIAALQSCVSLDPALEADWALLNARFAGRGTYRVVSVAAEAAAWLIYADGPSEPPAYYLYQRGAGVRPLVELYPQLGPGAFGLTRVEPYRAADGAALWAYLTIPPGGADASTPLVVLPHGGPESRDYFAFDPLAQFLASRGYVVLRPNFRGGGGFGRRFSEAGYRQWGAVMQTDVLDAVRHVIAAGLADPSRVCIVGNSYGGYVALHAAMASGDLFRCAVAGAGVSDLLQFLARRREVSGATSLTYRYWTRSIGDPRADANALKAASPAQRAAEIAIPVLLLHGVADDVVHFEQSQLMHDALLAAGRRSRLVPIVGEGHAWDEWKAENRALYLREVEAFLAEHLRN